MKLNKLSIRDRDLFNKFLTIDGHELSTYAFLNIYIWKGLFDIYWEMIDGALSVFFKDGGGCFMYLPPLAKKPKASAVEKAFAVMDGFNKNKESSRIENVEEKSLPFYKDLGYEYSRKSCDYLCKQADLAGLKGGRFKAKRASRNYFLKNYRFEYLPFAKKSEKDCLDLYAEWSENRRSKKEDYIYCGMLDDSLLSLKALLDKYDDLNIQGRVVLIKGKTKGFTFGFPLGEEAFCILYEITDLKIKGLSQFIFQKFCSELSDYEYINIMDDSGLDNLTKVKLSYHPSELAASYTVKRDFKDA